MLNRILLYQSKDFLRLTRNGLPMYRHWRSVGLNLLIKLNNVPFVQPLFVSQYIGKPLLPAASAEKLQTLPCRQ